MLKRCLVLLSLLICMPAQAMPNEAALREVIGERIAASTAPGLMEIIDFRSMGQAPDPNGDARIAYFSARLRLRQDHKFGAWDGQNLQALATALGAGPRAITGAKREGNRAGDVLRVNGALRLREEAGRWVPLAAISEGGSATAFDSQGARAERLLAAIGTALTAGEQAAGGRVVPVIEQELALAWRNIEARQARLRNGLPLAGGAAGSEYARLADAVVRLPSGPGLGRVIALPSSGSVENIGLLHEGTAAIAITQADVALRAMRGGAAEWGIPGMPGLRALAALYPEAVHVIVPATSAARDMRALRGLPIGVGAKQSGARVTAEDILASHGLDAASTPRIIIPPEEAATALRSGRIAALISVNLAPAQAILRLADSVPIRILALEEPAIERLTRPEWGLTRLAIPARSYPQQTEAIPTVATVATLVSPGTLTATEIAALLNRLFAGQGAATDGGAAALMIQREHAKNTQPLPLHLAAERFFSMKTQ